MDDPALEYSLKTDAFYIGCLGSKKTHNSRILRLKKKGINEEQLNKLNGPVGLSIGAKTPSEIAISIISQIILFKNTVMLKLVSINNSYKKILAHSIIINGKKLNKGKIIEKSDIKLLNNIGKKNLYF